MHEAHTLEEDCLHCVLGPVIQRFIESHPFKNPATMAGELTQVLAEFMASTAPAQELDSVIAVCKTKLTELTHLSAQEFSRKGLTRQ